MRRRRNVATIWILKIVGIYLQVSLHGWYNNRRKLKHDGSQSGSRAYYKEQAAQRLARQKLAKKRVARDLRTKKKKSRQSGTSLSKICKSARKVHGV